MGFVTLQSLLLLFAASVAVASPGPLTNEKHDHSPRSLAMKKTDMVASAHYTSWHADEFTLDDVPWGKYTHMYFAFVGTNEDPSNFTLSDSDSALLMQFSAKARENKVKPLVSIGGWTLSRYFSWNVGDEKNRTLFADAVIELVNKYQLSGADFSWEYPNRQGMGCNTISSNDTANYLAFFQQLRSKAPSFLITAEVTITTFNDENGEPSKDVSGFAKVLDWINIMNYDVWGSWNSYVGPNAPLDDTCVSSEYQQGSAVSAVKAWTSAGMPVDQIALGLATYGHSYYVNLSDAYDSSGSLAAYPVFDKTKSPRGDAWSDPGGVDACGQESAAGDTWNFWSLVDSGMLNEDGSPSSNISYRFDNCSRTDYLYNKTTTVEISYDGPDAYTAKGEYIKSTGLKGFAMWEAAGDTSKHVLLDAVRRAADY